MNKRCVVSVGCITYLFYGPEVGLTASEQVEFNVPCDT